MGRAGDKADPRVRLAVLLVGRVSGVRAEGLREILRSPSLPCIDALTHALRDGREPFADPTTISPRDWRAVDARFAREAGCAPTAIRVRHEDLDVARRLGPHALEVDLLPVPGPAWPRALP